MYNYTWYHWLAFFYIYSFFGWIFESTYVSLKSKHFVNRGFLRIPMLPLYGSGAVMMLVTTLPFKHNLILLYFSGVIGATILEYITGYVMERLFKMKYWDYSYKHYQINGYICLSSSIAWGFLTLFLTEIIHPPVSGLVAKLSGNAELLSLALISSIFVYDSIESTKAAFDLGRVLENLSKMRAEAEDLQVQLSLLKAEAEEKLAAVKSTTENKLEQLKFIGAEELSDKILTVQNKLALISEKRQAIKSKLGKHKISILRNNPHASSKIFSEAFDEIKSAIKSKIEKRCW